MNRRRSIDRTELYDNYALVALFELVVVVAFCIIADNLILGIMVAASYVFALLMFYYVFVRGVNE